MTIARSRGWMRIECLYRGGVRMQRKSASRIVAGCIGVKKTLRTENSADSGWISTPFELFRFAHSGCTPSYDCRAFSLMLFPCAVYWGLTAAARRQTAYSWMNPARFWRARVPDLLIP